MDKQKFDLRKFRFELSNGQTKIRFEKDSLNFPIDKQTKNLFGKHSVETFQSKTKNLLENFPLKNSVEKFPLKNQTLPGQNPRVKRNEKQKIPL